MSPIQTNVGYWIGQAIVNVPEFVVSLVGLIACLRHGVGKSSAARGLCIAAILQLILLGNSVASPLLLNSFACGDPARIPIDVISINNLVLHVSEALIMSLCLWTVLGSGHHLRTLEATDKVNGEAI